MTNLQKINLNPKIDSLSLRIKYSDCHTLNPKLEQETVLYYPNINQFDDEIQKPKPLTFSNNGITIRTRIAEMPIHNKSDKLKLQNQPLTTKFIVVTLSSKLLKDLYFQGMNKQNIFIVYQNLMNLNQFQCTFETFLNSIATDIDIAKDNYINVPNFQSVIKYTISKVGTKIKHLNHFNQPGNLGLNINTRITATPSLPYIKFYYKYWELQTDKTKVFFNTYLKPYHNEIKNLTRCEITIKNARHKKRLTDKKILPQFNTLKELLEIPSEVLIKFMAYSLNSYIEKKLIMINKDTLSPTEQAFIHLLEIAINEANFSEEHIQNLYTVYKHSNEHTQKSGRNRLKKYIQSLYSNLIHNNKDLNDKINSNNEVVNYFKTLGVNISQTDS